MAAVTGIACNRFTGPCTASAAAPATTRLLSSSSSKIRSMVQFLLFTKNAGCCRRYGSCPACSHAFCCLYCSPHARMASMMGFRLRPLAGRFFYFTAQTRCLSSRGRAPRTSGSKKFFCSPNCEKSAVHRKSFRIVTGQKSPAGNQVTALCVLYAGQKGVYHGLVSRGTPRCPAHPMQ